MAIIDKIIAQAKSNVKHIVLPEGEETRNIQAARKIADAGIAKLTVLGDPEKVKAVAAETNTCLCGIEIVDPKTSEKAASYASALYELRKAKGMTEEEAARKVQDPMFYGVMMVKMATPTVSYPARSIPPATCCAPRCRSSSASPASRPCPPAS